MENNKNAGNMMDKKSVSSSERSPENERESNVLNPDINYKNMENDYNGNDNLMANPDDFDETEYNDTDDRRDIRTPGL
jgi:hypothetical protein